MSLDLICQAKVHHHNDNETMGHTVEFPKSKVYVLLARNPNKKVTLQMLCTVSASDPVPVPEGMDEDMGFSLPPVLTEEKEELEESTPRPQPRRLVCAHTFHLESWLCQLTRLV